MTSSILSLWRRGLCGAVLFVFALLSAAPLVRAVSGTGNGVVIGSDIVEANGKVYDYVVMTGPAVTVLPDIGQVARVIFVDPDDDLVFVDYSGAGAMSIALDNPTGPAVLAKYKLGGGYWKGRARITIQGHNATSSLTVAAVGSRTSSVNVSAFKSDVTYDGVADLSSIQIVAVGASQFDGLRVGNARFSAAAGIAGITATDVTFLGPVMVGDIDATSNAAALPSPTNGVPSFLLGAATDVRILGGDLAQSNGANVRVSGFTELAFEATANAHGVFLPAKSNLGVLQNTVVAGQPVFTSGKSAAVFVGSALSVTVKASAVAAPTYSLAAGRLPAWASLNATTGVISGTPQHTIGSPFVFTVRATSGAATATQTFILSAIPSPTASNFVLTVSGDQAPDGNGILLPTGNFALADGAAAFATGITSTAGGAAEASLVVTASREGFRTVARSGSSGPNGATFLGVGGAGAINPSGRVTFGGTLSTMPDRPGIFSGTDSSSVVQIAVTGQPEPEGPWAFHSLGTPVINASNQVAFWSFIRDPSLPGFTGSILTGARGIFVGNGGPLTQIARSDMAAPGGGTFNSVGDPKISNTGEVAFGAGTTDGFGLFRGNGSTPIVRIVRKGDVPPEGNGQMDDIGIGWLNSNDKVAFYTGLSGTSGGNLDRWAIYRGTGGALTKIVRSGDQVPGAGGGQFEFLDNTLSINAQGDVSFNATRRNFTGHPELVVPGLYESVYLGNGTEIRTIARTGDPTPEGVGVFRGFVISAINDSRTVAFQAQLGSQNDNRGIYLGDGTETMLVARVGDQVLGSTIVQLGFDPKTYNNFKEIAYQAILADGRWAVLLFSPRLKWRQNGDGDWDDGSRWTVSLRPAGYAMAEIDPVTGGLVAGPDVATSLRSLKIGANTTSGTAELNLKATGPVTVAETATVAARGKVSGVGVVKGNVANAGTVSPGNSPGVLKIEGNFTQSAGGQSIFQIGGTNPELNDQLWVTGIADVAGTVKIELIGGFVPTAPVTVAVIRAQTLRLSNPTFQAPAGYTFTTAIKNIDDDQALEVTLAPPAALDPLVAVQSIASKELTAATAAFGFVPVTGSGGTLPYTYAVSPALPANLTFDASLGAISGTATAASSATYTITVTDAASATATNTFVLTVNPTVTTTLVIANRALAAGVAATAFTPVTAANGSTPYNFTISPALPGGLTLNATNGAISGTPDAAAAAANYTVVVTDSLGATSGKVLNLVVNPAVGIGPTISSRALTAGTEAVAFTPLGITGGTGPVAYAVNPALPTGLSLDVATGAITGTPLSSTASATYAITAMDSVGATVTQDLTLVVNAALVATSAIPTNTVAADVAVTPFTPVTIAGGTAPFTFAIAPALVPGLTMAAGTGTISGTPTLAGSAVTRTITITDAVGATASATTTLTVTAVAPTITVPPQSQAASMGASFTLSVQVTGSAPLSYQWRKGGVDIDGATGATFTIANAQASDADDYTVFVSNPGGDATSTAATITVIPAGFAATQAVVGHGYLAGGTVTVSNTFNYSGTLSALGWQVLLPAGWTFVSDTASAASSPSAGQPDVLDWAWITAPASGSTFTYTLSVPANATGQQTIAALYLPRQSATQYTMLVKPDPLVIDLVTFHSADTNQDWRFSLTELLRVIELYNTRFGTIRTGAYDVAVPVTATEDGFVADPLRPNTSVVTLASYHSADSDRDGKLSLTELLRVIELYNHRTGTVRDGLYHVDPEGTEDGFTAGAAPVVLSAAAGTTPETLTGGPGNDILIANQGPDILTGGGGANTFVIALPGVNISTYSTITDAKAGDKLQLKDKGTESFLAFKLVLPPSAVFQDYANAVAGAAGDASVNGVVGWFQFSGNTYVVECLHNGATTPAFVNGVDLIVKIAGLVNLSSATFQQSSSGAPEIVLH